MDLIQLLQWRYATKKMNATRAVPQEKVDRILEAIRLAPTSSGLQPYEVIVVTNKAVREKIMQIANGQMQIVEGSHLLVFAAWDDYSSERIDMMFDNLPTIIGQISSGQIRALAVSTAERWPGLPGVPTMAEAAIPGFDVTSWSGMLGPKGLPEPVTKRLVEETIRIGQDPLFQQRYLQMGARATMKGPEVLRARMDVEIPRWAEVVRESGAKLE